MNTRYRSAWVGIGLAVAAQAAGETGAPQAPLPALTLSRTVELAERNDPRFRAALKALEAGQEFETIGRAALLPTVQSGGNLGKNEQDRVIQDGNRRTEETRRFDSANLNLRVTQPLFSMDNWGRYRDGQARAAIAEAGFDDARQNFLIRVVGLYVNAVSALTSAELVERQVEDLEAQRRAVERRLERGDATPLDLMEVETAIQRAVAEQLRARAALRQANRQLENVTGLSSFRLAQGWSDRGHLERRPLEFLTLERSRLVEARPSVLAARSAVDLARAAVTRARGVMTPRVDAFAQYAYNDSDVVNAVGQRFSTGTVGLQFNMPLYLGGAAAANLRQAKAQLAEAEALLEAELADTRALIDAAVDEVDATRQAVEALREARNRALSVLEANQQGFERGVFGISDVLQARQQAYVVGRELARAREDHVLALLRAFAVAGRLDEAAIVQLEPLLHEVNEAEWRTRLLSVPASRPVGSAAPRFSLSWGLERPVSASDVPENERWRPQSGPDQN